MISAEGTHSYEALRYAVAALPPAETESDRTLVWVDSRCSIAIARDPAGRLEVFVVGEPVEAVDTLVAENVEHSVWTTDVGEPLPANRLVLTDAPHFDSVAAFICIELLEHGVADDHKNAFRRTEPVIALALRRASLSNQALVGLAGELFVLDRLVESQPHRAAEVVEGWFGSSRSSRDLQLGPIGVEIKTTTGSESVHDVQGLHQVEPGSSVGAAPETHLFLLSIGIEWLPTTASAGRSIPDLVEAISGMLPDSTRRESFLNRVKQYGGDTAIGYDHRTQRLAQRYGRSFQTRFERLYDLGDDRLHLLKTSDVADAVHVETSSISFRVRLPPTVRGDLNPIVGMSTVTTHLNRIWNAR